MICALNNYYFRVEHRMVVTEDERSSYNTSISDAISTCSIADHICYLVYEGKTLVTVILEKKQRFTINDFAQLLGYYYRGATSHQTIGLCLLLTKQSIHCILCPFRNQSDSLVNAICLKGITRTCMVYYIQVLILLIINSHLC